MSDQIFQDISSSFANLESVDKVKGLVNKALSEGISASEILEKALRVGLDEVGKKYEACEYFLAELLFSAEIMKEVMEMLRPELEKQAEKKKGTIVLGTVRGDIHDIGKNIFKMLAISSGFTVADMGVDVEPAKFIEKVKETKAEILAMSALLTTVLPEIKMVVDEVKKAGIRDTVKIVIGGNAVTKEFAQQSGIDDAALDAVEGINICKELVTK
jgi:5-methyltetrahydrofolate--homocysteine methyltransferase